MSTKAKKKLSRKQLAALAKGRRARAAKLAAGKAPRKAPKKAGTKPKAKAQRSTKATAKPKAKAQRSTKKAQRGAKLTPQEQRGMGIVADLIDAQFASNGSLAASSAFVRRLTDDQRRALIAADRRIRKAAGRN
jgi:hypothetical protein